MHPDLNKYGSLTCSTFQTSDALQQTADSTNAYSSANPKFAEEYWQALMGATNTVSSKFNSNKGFTRGANIARMWFTTAQCNKYGSGVGSGLGTVFTLMPTDIFGNQKGALGYTYFSTAVITTRFYQEKESMEVSLSLHPMIVLNPILQRRRK